MSTALRQLPCRADETIKASPLNMADLQSSTAEHRVKLPLTREREVIGQVEGARVHLTAAELGTIASFQKDLTIRKQTSGERNERIGRV